MREDDHAQPALEICSFHLVFALERRIHRIDRWRLPFPHGIAVAALGYGAAALAALIAAGRLPATGVLLSLCPAPLKYVIAPLGIGHLLSRSRIDGRPVHRHLTAVARRRFAGGAPRTLPGRRVRSGTLHVIGAVLLRPGAETLGRREATLRGPAVLQLTHAARLRPARSRLEVSSRPLRRHRRVHVPAGRRLRVQPGRSR